MNRGLAIDCPNRLGLLIQIFVIVHKLFLLNDAFFFGFLSFFFESTKKEWFT